MPQLGYYKATEHYVAWAYFSKSKATL